MGAIPLKPLHLNGSDMSYYYLAASLPMLSLDGEPPISLEDFLNRCDEHLSKKDSTALDALFSKHDTASRHTFVRAWRDRETQLRNAIVRVRAQRQSLDPASFLHHQDGFDSSVEKAVADAFSRANPLERERALDRVRWATAEELSGFDPFTGSAILAYALKLNIALRWASQDSAAGLQQAQTLVARNPQEATS
ncbi:MAG TPA: hypothetical protein DEW46_04960 [Verrucomicrobia bacterium]|nr:hypothetical protein [Verrucomicrobiota bacterium]